MKVDLRTFDNRWYIPGKVLPRLLWFFVNGLILQNPLNPSSHLKIVFLKLFGAKIGKGVVIKPGVNIKYPWNLSIGNYCWIGEKVWIDNLAQVTIENHVCLSQGAMLVCGNHNYKKQSFDLLLGNIYIESGVWVASKAIVCPGTTLKSHSVLTVASIANSDLEAYSIYQGNPAIKIRDRNIT